MIAVLFIILVLCLFIGVPVGFSIGISAMSFLAVSQFTPVTIMAQRLVDGLNSCLLYTSRRCPIKIFGSSYLAESLSGILCPFLPWMKSALKCLKIIILRKVFSLRPESPLNTAPVSYTHLVDDQMEP